MMHPAHYMDSLQSRAPETITDMLEMIAADSNSPLQLISTRDNADAQRVVAEFQRELEDRSVTGANALPNGRGWSINAHDGWYILGGSVYPGAGIHADHLEAASPLLLIDRKGGPNNAYYGAELRGLARTVLKNSLVYQAACDAQQGKAPLPTLPIWADDDSADTEIVGAERTATPSKAANRDNHPGWGIILYAAAVTVILMVLLGDLFTR